MIKGQGFVNKYLNTRYSQYCKKLAAKKIKNIRFDVISNTSTVDIYLHSISSSGNFVEQVFSILSFVKNVGIPLKWTVISDGSYTTNEIIFLQQFSFVEVKSAEEIILPEYRNFALYGNYWQYKKFFSYANTEILNKPTVFLDCDIFFYPMFIHYFNTLHLSKNWSIILKQPNFDSEFKHDESGSYIISAFYILNNQLNWATGINYLLNRHQNNLPVNHFTEQTAIEIVFKNHQVAYLDRNVFYTDLDDHFTLGSHIINKEIAIRHYPGYIRFRFWIDLKKENFFL